MNKDKLTDPRDNTIENKKEDYTDGNGNPEDFIEDTTDSEATAIFKEAFYAEGKALEEEALRSPFGEDEEKKEALRLRILAAAGRSVADDAVVSRSTIASALGGREMDATAENAVLEHKAALENQSNDTVSNKAVVGETATESASGETMTVSETPARNNDTVKASVEDVKKKKRRFFPFMRWAAVLALVCVGVFGVSVTGQAKGSGLWSSIQRLIGVETRWDQDDNGEDRNISDPEEYKAIEEIQEKLGINIPKFFYWPGELKYKDLESFEESNSFMMRYSDGENTVFFEGWKSESNASSNYTLQGEGDITYEEYDGISYAIIAVDNEIYNMSYYVMWSNSGYKYVLSGIRDFDELQKILKNIKN